MTGLNQFHVLVLPSWYPTPEAPLNGIFFKEQALALRKAGSKVGVVYPEFRSLRTFSLEGILKNRFQVRFFEEEGIPTYRFCGWNLPRLRVGPRLWVCLVLRLFERYVRKFGMPDLVHAHSVLWGGVAAMQICRQHGTPYVITEHSSHYARGLIQDWQEPHIRNSLMQASAILAVGSGLMNHLSQYAPEKKITLVPNMVDTDFFTLPRWPRSESPFRLLTVALLTPNKGIDLLIRAFAEVLKVHPDAYLEIGGDGPQRGELESLAVTLGVADKVCFLGMLSREGVRDAMWRANAFVLPSYVETFGVVLIEALATGLPVIATRSGGPEDFISPMVGLLINPGNINELRQGLCYLLAKRGFFAEKVMRQYVTNRYGEKAIAETLLGLYKGIGKE